MLKAADAGLAQSVAARVSTEGALREARRETAHALGQLSDLMELQVRLLTCHFFNTCLLIWIV